MKNTKLKRIFATALTVALSLSVLAGCGKKDSGSTAAAEQIVRYNLGANPKTLDPALNSAVDGAIVLVNAFEGLMKLDNNDQPVAGVAESYEMSADGLTYTFKLRKDAKWSDGSQVTAGDFEYAWKRALDPATAAEYAYQMYYLKNGESYNTNGGAKKDDVGVKATDESTLVVTLENPTPYFLSLAAFPTYFPVKKDVVEKDADWANKPETYISNGAFKMKEFLPKDSITFVKNDNYYGKDSVKLDTIKYTLVEDQNSAYASLKAGDLDMTDSVPSVEIEAGKSEGIVKTFPNLGTYFYVINVGPNAKNINADAAKALSDAKVRKALNLAINRKDLVSILKGGQEPAFSFVPTGINVAGGKDFAKTQYFKPEGDMAEAKKLLAEAGYADGKGLPTIEVLYNSGAGHEQVAQAVQDMWKTNLGINVEIKAQEWAVFQTTRKQKNYSIARHGWLGDYVDPMTFLDMWVTGSGQNDAAYSNAKYDELIGKAKTETDAAKRVEYMQDAEAQLMEDMPIIPLYYYTQTKGLKPYVKDVHISPLGFVYFQTAFVEAH